MSNEEGRHPMVKAWCVTWQTHVMPAPAFWYYKSAIKADDAFWGLSRQPNMIEASKRSARVPANTPFMDVA